jgi:hypothetical protein
MNHAVGAWKLRAIVYGLLLADRIRFSASG